MSWTVTDTPAESTSSALEGKYLTFILGKELYGLSILKVKEIIGVMDITAVPNMLFYMKGVINLRGKVIPVLDLRLKFGLEEQEYTEKTCVIVVEVEGCSRAMLAGILVDTVSEVLYFSPEDIEPPPSLGSNDGSNQILGMAKHKGRVHILLDINKVVMVEELVDMGKVT